MRTGDCSGTGQVLDKHTVTVLETLNNVARALGYEEKYERYNRENSGTGRHGVGLACSMRGVSIGSEGLDVSRVYIEVEEDASVLVSCGYTEQGQGLRTALAQITAEAMGCSLERITMNIADTSRAPSTGAAIASRGTFTGGHAILDATRKIKQTMIRSLCGEYGAEPDKILFKGDRVILPGRTISFSEAVTKCYGAGMTPAANGTFVNYPLAWDHEKCCGEAFVSYTYSCHGADVEVDLASGKVKVLKMIGSHDAGRVINQSMACGQVLGGLVMSAGMALTEDLGSRNGICRNLNFDNYIIPGIMDVGENEAIMVDNPDPRGPFGAKSLGEPSLEPGAAAVSCAVNHALRASGGCTICLFLWNPFFFLERKGSKMQFADFLTPETPEEAVRMHAQYGDEVLYVAGATDVLVAAREKEALQRKVLIDLSRLKQLRYIREDDVGIHIGALCTHAEIAASNVVRRDALALAKGCLSIGSPQIRNTGTIGGNIANASPAADSFGPLALLKASVTLLGRQGVRTLPLDQTVTGPYHTGLTTDELILEVIVEKLEGYRQDYCKLGRRESLAISRMTVSAAVKLDCEGKIEDLRVSLGAVFPRPLLFEDVGQLAVGMYPSREIALTVAAALADKIPEVAGIRASTRYKTARMQESNAAFTGKRTGGFAA